MENITTDFVNRYIHTRNENLDSKFTALDNDENNEKTQNIPSQNYLMTKGLYGKNSLTKKEKIIDTGDGNITDMRRYRVSRVNIDSRYRNIETKNILDSKITYLEENPLSFIQDSNTIRIHHKNHGFDVEDKIVIQGIQNESITINNGITMFRNSEYLRINHINHNLNTKSSNDLYVTLSNVVGNAIKNTSIQNVPINDINKSHKIYFKRTENEIPNTNYYFIKIDTKVDTDFEYNLTTIGLYYLQISGVPQNEINANYPISNLQLNGYHIIENIIDENNYEISASTKADTTTAGVGGNKCWVARVVDFIEGYPNNNYYKISLKKTFYHVTRIKLISTEFPNTERVIKNYPSTKQNNILVWQISNDGDKVYNIEITPGNYTISTLKSEIEGKVAKIQRDTLIYENANVEKNNYFYNTYIIPEIDIKSETDTFVMKLYEQIIVKKPITISNLLFDDGFTRIRVFHPNHKLVVGDTVTIDNAASTEGVPTETLNKSHIVENVFDKDNYQIKLDRYNTVDNDVTNGGEAVSIKYMIKFRLLFNQQGTIGKVLGFNNIGQPNSITRFVKEMTNNIAYENQTEADNQQRIINLSGDNYILMTSPLFKETYSSGPIDGIFAKLLLSSDPGTVMFNQFIQIGETFKTPINSLSELEVTFYDPTGDLFYFNNIEHSYTLEIYEDLSQE